MNLSQFPGAIRRKFSFSTRHQWTILRATLMMITVVFHVALLVVSAIALARRSAGAFQIGAILLNLAALCTVAMFRLAKRFYSDRRWDKKRNVCTFAGLTVFSFALLILFVARMLAGKLSSDYETVGGAAASIPITVVASFKSAFAVVGLASALLCTYDDEEPSHVEFQFRKGPGFSYPDPRLSPAPYFDVTFVQRGLYPDGTPVPKNLPWSRQPGFVNVEL